MFRSNGSGARYDEKHDASFVSELRLFGKLTARIKSLFRKNSALAAGNHGHIQSRT
jgi:hypothetical protein